MNDIATVRASASADYIEYPWISIAEDLELGTGHNYRYYLQMFTGGIPNWPTLDLKSSIRIWSELSFDEAPLNWVIAF
jgi:hypothetical protein